MFHPNFNVTLTDSFIKGLACAAIYPGLRRVLVFNAPYTGFKTAATIFSQLLETVTGRTVEQVYLGVSESEDDLWGNLALHNHDHNSTVIWHQGRLMEGESDSHIRLALISDLTKLSLAAARTCVMLLGADVAHLERHGQHKRWRPDICWLANCPAAEVGSVSPHLLDRFAMRLNWPLLDRSDEAAVVLDQVLNEKLLDDAPVVSLPVETRERVKRASRRRATPTDEAFEQILYYTSQSEVYTPRRELALARYALAVAQLESSDQVLAIHVDIAANLMGLISSSLDETALSSRPGEVSALSHYDLQLTDTDEVMEIGDNGGNTELSTSQTESIGATEPVYAPDETIVLSAAAMRVDPYPEDKAPIEREAATLRLPLFRHAVARAGHGTIIGVERASSLQDLALVSTLIAAAPFQPIRRKYRREQTKRLLLSSADLRCYRREPTAEHLLLLLLDYTSLRSCDWQEALLPYLRKAYTERANIGIVQVGVAHAAHELRAGLVSARSILVPRIAEALNAPTGRATPLAHGFELVLRTLRHALQHGRSTVQQALLIVVSDGRGNVPLEASRNGRILRSVGREGVEDALRMARLIRNMKSVRTLLLNPQPRQHQELPVMLAIALGAEVKNIRLLEREEI